MPKSDSSILEEENVMEIPVKCALKSLSKQDTITSDQGHLPPRSGKHTPAQQLTAGA